MRPTLASMTLASMHFKFSIASALFCWALLSGAFPQRCAYAEQIVQPHRLCMAVFPVGEAWHHLPLPSACVVRKFIGKECFFNHVGTDMVKHISSPIKLLRFVDNVFNHVASNMVRNTLFSN